MQGAWVDTGAVDAVDEGLAVGGRSVGFLGGLLCVLWVKGMGGGRWWEDGLWCLCCLCV